MKPVNQKERDRLTYTALDLATELQVEQIERYGGVVRDGLTQADAAIYIKALKRKRQPYLLDK